MNYRVIIAVGARPNFMKATSLFVHFRKYSKIEPVLVHTGQHYDKNLSTVFFQELKLPRPDYYCAVGSGTHSVQSARVMVRFEKILESINPHAVVVVGDVNSTLACALAAAKFRCSKKEYRPLIAHVEAGLRSFDWRMPEEINRRLTDALSDLLFITEPSARRNLQREGIAPDKIFYVGNTMIDSLERFRRQATKSDIIARLNLEKKQYAVLTLHRPTNVDEKKDLQAIRTALKAISRTIPIVFPVHPRTTKMLARYHMNIDFMKTVPPLGYLDFLNLMHNARFVLTDSGGIQEEATVLNIPCLTLRDNTERPITVALGTNTLVGKEPGRIIAGAERIMKGLKRRSRRPKYWDGRAGERICRILYEHLKELR